MSVESRMDAVAGPARRSWAALAAAAAVVAAVVALLLRLRALDWGRLEAALRALGPGPLAIGIAGGGGVVALQALRWWTVTRPVVTVSYAGALRALLVGGLLNALLPARAGDLLRVQYLADSARVSRATLYGTELVDFWTDKCGWLPAFVLLGLTGPCPSWMHHALAVMSGLAVLLLVLVLTLRHRLRGAAASDGWRGRFAMGLAASSPTRLAVTALLLAALPWLWEAFAITAVGRAAGIGLVPVQAFVVLTAFNLAMIVPMPAGLGVHEAASAAVLVSYGVPIERAVVFALAYHASQLLPYVVGGAASLASVRRRPLSLQPR